MKSDFHVDRITVSTAVVCFIASVLAGILGNYIWGLATVAFGIIATFFVDLRLVLARKLDTIAARSESPLIRYFNQLSGDPCSLFRKLATEKYRETEDFLGELVKDRVQVRDLRIVYGLLEFLFCECSEIKEILATSYGELREWSQTEAWWGMNYMRIHDVAIARGKRITRILIFHPDEIRLLDSVVRLNIDHKVVVKKACADQIAAPDIRLAGNCIVFCNRKKQPIYCLLASHQGSELEQAEIYRDERRIQEVVNAVKRIDSISVGCVLA